VATPQAILAPTGLHQHHLELVVRPGVAAGAVAAAVGGMWSRRISGRVDGGEGGAVRSAGGLTAVVVGFGPALWESLAPGEHPAGFGPARPVHRPDGSVAVPATQRDLWVWLNGSHYGTVLDAATAVVEILDPVAAVAMEQPCFLHQDSRTWEGFIDGTENPGPFEAAEVAIVADGQPGAGGSTAIVERWVNTGLSEFARLDTAAQEAAFGRTKRDSVQLDPLPPTSHVARNVLVEDGEELHIVRRNIPFGTVRERGYVFVGLAADQSRVTRMLERMFGADAGPGEEPVEDAITAYLRAESGSSYFVPSLQALERVGAGPVE
jgi:putative iron-dependent peroxidase